MLFDSLNKNFRRPSNVCARPETIVPIAENALPMTPRMVLMIPWKTARIEPMIAVMPWTIEEISDPRLSRKEGMFVCGVFCKGAC